MNKTTGQFAQKTESKRKNPFSCKPDKDFPETTNSPFSQILHLQRTVGNRAVTGLLRSGAIQAKLKIGQPNDKYEQEADRVADQVMSMEDRSLVNSHSSLVQRKSTCPECTEKKEIQSKPLAEQITPLVQREMAEEEEVQEKPFIQRQIEDDENEKEELLAKRDTSHPPEVTSNIEFSINALKGGGQPLTESTRSFFEPRFGTNFSQVRVHNDSRAANTAQAINAKAFTIGRDIVFSSGQYSPESTNGKRLLAHELTHTIQQEGKANKKNVKGLQTGGKNLSALLNSSLNKIQRKVCKNPLSNEKEVRQVKIANAWLLINPYSWRYIRSHRRRYGKNHPDYIASLTRTTSVTVIDKGIGKNFNKTREKYHWWCVEVNSGDHIGKDGWIEQRTTAEYKIKPENGGYNRPPGGYYITPDYIKKAIKEYNKRLNKKNRPNYNKFIEWLFKDRPTPTLIERQEAKRIYFEELRYK